MIRRLARLHEGLWKHEFGAEWRDQKGVFGHGLGRMRGILPVLVHKDASGNEFDEVFDPIFDDLDDSDELSKNPIFGESRPDIEKYAHLILEKYNLPRPKMPGYFWQDWDSGELRWGSEPPENNSGEVTGLWDSVAEKFIEQEIKADPKCWEAVLASEYLSEIGELNADITHWQYDTMLELGMKIGAIICEWRIGLLHGAELFGLQMTRRKAGEATGLRNRERARANPWKNQVIAYAEQYHPSETNMSHVARLAIKKLKITNRQVGTVARALSAWKRASTKPFTPS